MSLRELLKNIPEPVLVIAHRNTDFDGYASILLIDKALRTLGKRSIILASPEGVSKPVRDLLEKFNIPLKTVIESPEKLNVKPLSCVIVDTSSLSQIEDFINVIRSVDSLIWIDHHSVRMSNSLQIRNIHIIADKNATSTCEIILREIPELLDDLDTELSIISLAAILVDSRRLSKASSTTFQILSKIVKNIENIYEKVVSSIFQREMPFDEKMARIKGMLRTEAYRFNNNILCISHVSAHEASLARLLLEAGCDIAIVVSEHEKEFRIIARSRIDLVSMAELCQRVASKYMGQGGGHDRAGAAAIPKSQDLRLRRLMRDVVRTISEMLNQRLRKVRPR
ncbi:MAG: hypothetical protein GXO26_05665 [Crenarchaeota archaeon]|nr:hypothetical protein [Thermoproteota archaeon]